MSDDKSLPAAKPAPAADEPALVAVELPHDVVKVDAAAVREWCEAKGLRLGPDEVPDHGYVQAYLADKAYLEHYSA